MSEHEGRPPEAELSQLEYETKLADLKLKQAELRSAGGVLRRFGITGTEATVLVAIITLLGTSVASNFQRAEEHRKELAERATEREKELRQRVAERKAELQQRDKEAQQRADAREQELRQMAVELEKDRRQREADRLNAVHQAMIAERTAEVQLVTAVLSAGESSAVVDRMRFLIDSGYLSDKNGNIRSLILSGQYGDVSAPLDQKLFGLLMSGDLRGLVNGIARIGNFDKDISIVKEDDLSVAAYAKIDGDKYSVHYDSKAIEQLTDNGNPNWHLVAVLAHEVSHIALHRTQSRCSSDERARVTGGCMPIRTMELEGDRFAGVVLRRMGASLADAQSVFSKIPVQPADGYPGRQERVAAITAGWRTNRPT